MGVTEVIRRTQSLKWWQNLSPQDKSNLTDLIISPKKSYKSLTTTEVLEIYNWHTNR